MLLVLIFIILSKFIACISKCSLDNSSKDFKPHSPLIKDDIFLVCDPHGIDLKGNITAKEELGYGCIKFGGQKFHDVEVSRTFCRVLDGIECYGDRMFLTIKEYPCIKYNGHYFINTLIYSLLLGFLGMDRFCLGHTGTAVGKLLTFGGLGVWWIVDIVLLILGDLSPADDSNAVEHLMKQT